MPQFEPLNTVNKLKYFLNTGTLFAYLFAFLDFPDFYCSRREKLKDRMVR